MAGSSDPFESLREAIRLSPDNLPLRRTLADLLLQNGDGPGAEQAYREALGRFPKSVELQLGLARAFSRQAKHSEAFVVLEQLVKQPDVPPEAILMYARALERNGQVADAVAQYKLAVEADPDACDEAMEERLGISSFRESTYDEVVEGRQRMMSESPSDIVPEMERPQQTFSDVGGMDEVKEQIRLKIIYPLTNHELYKAYGKKVGGGILLYGPPGCGKTHLARATAGEIDAAFFSIGLNDVLDMWIGNSERNLHELFETGRRNTPCVLFFDEVDALGARRSDMRQSAGRQLINQFLSELDGVKANNDGLLILAATNAPWHMDPAFRRPGRFDRIIFVPPPDPEARAEILKLLCEGKPQKNLDFNGLAKKSAGFSGADLKAVVDLAVEEKLQAALKTGIPEPLQTADLQKAIQRHKPTVKEWFATARNHALYANEGGMYDDIVEYLR
ncbi:ATP-binding protein [Rubinisphaera margarita]|uniref:ATP-binding protein n=1 Tax=Rubinisphaera margarita TaxID=2909586 RepID=UPI001EE89B9D|nr:ATP-binding protein [Rubinisphaera margarita]MCG6155938.1 AAA family ATPase [Rubinisphaera margarita]